MPGSRNSGRETRDASDGEAAARPTPEPVRLLESVTHRRPASAPEAEAARGGEAHLRAVFDAVAVGLVVVDLEGRIVDANPAYERLVGKSAPDLRGTRFLAYSHPDDASADWTRFVELRAGKRDRYQMEKRYLSADGTERYADVVATLVRGESEQPLYCIRTVEDVTERKLFEEALRYGEEQVRQMQKMEAIGRLAGGVAHDFNTMLGVINGYADLLLQIAPPDSPLRPGLSAIKEAGERSAALTRQLLAFGRRQVLQPRILDVETVVSGMMDLLGRLLGEDIQLTFTTQPALGRIYADAGQIEQVLMNLAVNARDAMPLGGALAIRAENRDVGPEEALRGSVVPGPYVRLSVADSGCGLDEALQERIFEPFFTTKPAGQGTGLGLATVYGIVRQSEGWVEVESRPGEGATFHVYLPRVDGEPDPEPPLPPRRAASGSGTVLLVEDEPMLRGLVREVLRRRGYHVLTAAGATEALALAASWQRPIRLLLTDVVLPGRSGFELAAELSAIRPGVKVLFMSGHTEAGVRERGTPLPGSGFIQKPFSPDALAARIEELLTAETSSS